MSLDASTLESALRDFFATASDTPADAAQTFADIYCDYAAGGVFGANAIVIDDTHKSALAAALLAGISAPVPSGVPFASAWSAGVSAFWAGLVVVGPVQAGATTAAPGAAGLVGTLTAVFAAPQEASVAAAGLAAALDVATKTATATVSPPGGTVLPIG